MYDDAPRILTVDSGPIIGVMYEDDEHHEASRRGFRQLMLAGTTIVVPVPIVFEVYKRLAYDVGPTFAHRGLNYMQSSLTLLYLESKDLDALNLLVLSMPWWGGSLEDAAVAMVGRAREIPVWTFNYRDFAAFRDLSLWNPA